MSVLETPRIYFRGEVTWDPITTNNQPTFYDEADAETVFGTPPMRVAAFRRNAIAAVVSGGNWNPHGTHRARFYDAGISGADCGSGLVQNDPFVNSPANFLGMLVDLEPYGAFSSQLFFDGMSFGIDGGYRIAARRSTRFTARYINFTRSRLGPIAGVASVIWRTTFPKNDGLRVDAFDSPVLSALRTALEDDDVLGIAVQWNAYRTTYYDSPDAIDPLVMAERSTALLGKLIGGGWQPNPARSRMVGVIGLWRRGEAVSEPSDRTLITGPDDPPRPPNIGTAQARLAKTSITLDLSNSISETGLDLAKKDFGDLSVVSVADNGTATTLATFGYSQYDRDAYERTSGIVTLPVDATAAANAASATLQLRDSSGNVFLAEDPVRAIPVVPNVYIDQGQTGTAHFQLYDRGVPAGGGVEVTLCVMSADGNTVENTFTLYSAADGTITFPLAGLGGITPFIPLIGPNPQLPQNGLNPLVYTYLYVRVLPADDNIAQLPPTWDNVYAHVLSNWHAMAPCMDNWLNLGDEQQVRSFAPLLKKLTNAAAFEHFRYMPVTRDLTPGCRTLLYNFLDSPAGVTGATMPKSEPHRHPTFADLSRKMRS